MPSKVKKELSSPRLAKRKISYIDILASILNEAHKGARKTRIVRKCHLNRDQLEVHLKFLLDKGLLAPHSHLFKTTAKGLKFLDEYRTLKPIMT